MNYMYHSSNQHILRRIILDHYPHSFSRYQNLWKSQRFVSQNRSERGPSSYKFVDKARIRVTAGRGGNGCLSYATQMKSHYKKRPDGGHGGQGGYVILVADENEQSLNMQRHHFQAQDGKHGSSQQLHGRNGKDLIIRVPRGVVVKKVQDAWGEENVYSVLQQDDDNHDDDLIVYPETFNKDSWAKATQGKRDGLLLSKEEVTEDDIIASQTNITEVIDNDDVKSSQTTRAAGMSLRAQRRQRRTLKKTPHDYDDIVNTGEKSAEDGMYYWSPMKRQSALDDDDREIKSNNMNPEDDTEDNDVQWEEKQVEVIADLDQAGSFVIVAHGGKGGIGNSIYASRQFSDQHSSKAAKKAVGQVGETTYLELELKLIADIGLVGFPNAGKSSLLAAMSMAKPAIAPYPFTTLHPLVGCIEYRDGFRVLVADVPGLIDGASYGRGRGYDFLRHLERTKALIYIVDSAGVDGRDPVNDLKVLFDEISSYGDGVMIERPSLIVANKIDLIPDTARRDTLFKQLALVSKTAGITCPSSVYGISAGVTGDGLMPLSRGIRNIIENSIPN